ncbi:MAG: MerR family transcriptional regulator [Pseudomonadota bacterium]
MSANLSLPAAQPLSIGAVAKLTGIPAHTLRKWESRHGIGRAERSPTGRRVYSPDQVEVLTLTKQLAEAGHALGHLGACDVGTLRQLAGMHQDPEPPQLQVVPQSAPSVTEVVLIGPTASRLQVSRHPVRERYRSLDDWLCDVSATPDENVVAVIETSTLTAQTMQRLEALRPALGKLIVVYTFCSKRMLAKLHDAGIETLASPVTLAALEQHLAPSPPVRANEPRFNTEELLKLANMSSGLQCECPNQIAKLLMTLQAFERYCSECSDTDPEQAALHQALGDITIRSRILFEDAMSRVAIADGIDLASLA